ncbi:hypothetical protein LCGC14_1136690 [marine sediment metagenome]|uniref:Uncharacterized protein n=1 Tax=marine sediment metagenome TaxID=412755 RepID=A0A0F9M4D6_9ZZZZ
MAERKFPIQDGPSVPWEFMVSHEAQHKKNHGGQTLERMAQRGGLGATEAWCCVNGMGLWPTHDTKEGMAKAHQDWIALAERVNREWNDKRIRAEVLGACIKELERLSEEARGFGFDDDSLVISNVKDKLKELEPTSSGLEELLEQAHEAALPHAAEQLVKALTEGGEFAVDSPLVKVKQCLEALLREAEIRGAMDELALMETERGHRGWFAFDLYEQTGARLKYLKDELAELEKARASEGASK